MKKTAVVTGANKGIGFEVARNLAKKGFTVWLGARDEKRGADAARELQKDNLDVRFLQLDVTSDASVTNAAKKVEAESGSVDVLVNNAGIFLGDMANPKAGKDSKASATSTQTLIDTYQVNVFGAFRTTNAFLPLMRKAKNASIVMVSSGLGSLTLHADPNGQMASVEAISYNSSKTALNALMIGFANDLRPSGIRVNSVNPGYTKTDLNGNLGTDTTAHAAEIVVKAAFLDDVTQTARAVGETADCPW